MAFPFETTQLLASIRTSHVGLADNVEYVNRIIKPMKVRHNGDKIEYSYVELELSGSPPITFDIARHVQKSMKNNEQPNEEKHSKQHKDRKQSKSSRKKIKSSKHRKHSNNSTTSLVSVDKSSNQDGYNVEGIMEYEYNVDSSKSNGEPELNYTKTIKGVKGKSRMTKSNFSKLFSSRGTPELEEQDCISEVDEEVEAKTGTPEDNKSRYEKENKSNNNLIQDDCSDAITIDSDFGVPISSTGEVLRNVHIPDHNFNGNKKQQLDKTRESDLSTYLDEEGTDTYSGEDEEEEDEDEDDEDEDDEDEDDEDTSSTDSAFTDIETDSIMDSSMLLDSYDNGNSPSYSFGKHELLSSFKIDSKKARKRKRRNSIDTQSLATSKVSGSTTNLRNMNSQSSTNNGGNKNNTNMNFNTKHILSSQRSQLEFQKIDPVQKEFKAGLKYSNLSEMIHSKFKSSNTNPLSYFSFVGSSQDANATKVSLNVFLPPKTTPLIKALSINNNVAISDCIGYILLKLSQFSDFKNQQDDESYLNPNCWRLELVDEDGENYGSFGILDRTRLFSSYNNPTELAICKVSDKDEILSNNKLSPLSLEFKQSLGQMNQANKVTDSIEYGSKEDNDEDKTMELNILTHLVPDISVSSLEKIKYYSNPNVKVGELTTKFCSDHGLDPTKYSLRIVLRNDANDISHKHPEAESTLLQGNLIHNLSPANYKSINLFETDLVSRHQGDTFELVPRPKGFSDLGDSLASRNSGISVLNNIITPTDSTFTVPVVFPIKKQLEDKMQKLTLENAEEGTTKMSSNLNNDGSKKSGKNDSKIDTDKYLNDIMLGKNPSLPTNLNSIYFKWKVWRKKTTIINKIEKSLIIDGDYIHLTPPDDIVFKKNPSDNPFASESQAHNHNHHHHLYHYNYSNYYKESLMKTSSFHITQIIKLKQYKNSKNPNHFKIVITKQVDNSTSSKDNNIQKKYDLEAANIQECQEIIDKIHWVLSVYRRSNLG